MFSFPEGLNPAMNPLAWLPGAWKGWGVISYPGVPDQVVLQDITFTYEETPWLRQESRLYTVTEDSAALVEREMTGAQGVAVLERGQLLSVETSYWRPSAVTAEGEPVQAVDTLGDPEDAAGNVAVGGHFEVLSTDPSGYVMMWVGQAEGPRIQMVTDAVVRSPDAPELNAATRLFALVESDLMWAQDVAALGHELQSYISGRLSREA
ncbi:MAG: FABP family protein [Actinomycetaceae bacterium]|nr:FABP family protein [Actinomycetaceae bacterium]